MVSCSEKDKMTYASHILRGQMTWWWVNAANYMETQGVPKQWEHFKVVSLDKYFSDNLMVQKEFKF